VYKVQRLRICWAAAMMITAAALLLSGCASTRATVFVNPEFGFAGVERVAIIPFENLTSDQGVGDFVARLFMTELLAKKAFDIVEPGDVSKFVAAHAVMKASEQPVETIQEMGKTLNVQALIFGTVGESTQFRAGSLTTHVISLNLRMVSTETGSTVWSASVNTTGPGFFSRLLGVGEQSRGSAVRLAVRRAIKSLVK
jgi:polysaccharide biosynthesis protein PelC